MVSAVRSSANFDLSAILLNFHYRGIAWRTISRSWSQCARSLSDVVMRRIAERILPNKRVTASTYNFLARANAVEETSYEIIEDRRLRKSVFRNWVEEAISEAGKTTRRGSSRKLWRISVAQFFWTSQYHVLGLWLHAMRMFAYNVHIAD